MEIQDSLTDESVLKELSGRIKQIRIDRGITQTELAGQANVSLSTVVRLESGSSVQMDSFIRILRALRLLGKFNVLVPEQELHPVELLRPEAKQKKRVSSKRQEKTADDSAWKWGDEK
ncbi:MAG: helix-turn-helix domain-containing protein [Treponema sp.]|nr:helix-turn-helix domain-containing protein [Treponema sp.]